MLTHLFTSDPHRWRVIGITENALLKFKENNFEYKTGIKIQRAHVNNRHDIYKEMLVKKFNDCDEWWEFYYKNDETILALSSENRKVRFSKIFNIDPELGLFRSHTFIWLHNEAAKKKLEDIYINEYLR